MARIHKNFSPKNRVTLYHGDCLDLLKQIPDESAQLVVTSPPYNLGKEYEKREKLDDYVDFQKQVITESARILGHEGSICWQIGNYVQDGAIIPLDILLYPIFDELGFSLRNRIVWHFGHGLHARKRFSGRYETILWFTKSDDYYFDLDPVRVPQKYPNKKHYKGPNKGKLSGNPLGKNPADVWSIPNVKNNHVEKTIHPCQFPSALIERLVLSMARENDLVVDPFVGVGTTNVAALKHGRRSAGADTEKAYIDVARERARLAIGGELKTRPLNKPLYEPGSNIRVESA